VRRRYIDLARGLAVLVMIEAHALDAWTRVADRSTPLFRYLNILGGFAAPLFLWLAGLALVISAEAALSRGRERSAVASRLMRRGLEVFVLAFLFRLQALIITPGSPLITLFRVDILNIMGPSIAAAGLVWGLIRNRALLAAALGILTTCTALVTPVVRTAGWVDSLPIWFQWYVRPSGEHTTFTTFPWAGFVFAGSAAGILIAAARSDAAERRSIRIIAELGLALVGIGYLTASMPSIYRSSSFWTSSPTYFAIRVGVMMVGLAAVFAVAGFASAFDRWWSPIERMGCSSLFVYWIHVELVYGYLTWPIHHRLTLWQNGVAYAAFCALMHAAIVFRDRLLKASGFRSSDRTPSVIST
jgi:uncharacterized membrane protein